MMALKLVGEPVLTFAMKAFERVSCGGYNIARSKRQEADIRPDLLSYRWCFKVARGSAQVLV